MLASRTRHREFVRSLWHTEDGYRPGTHQLLTGAVMPSQWQADPDSVRSRRDRLNTGTPTDTLLRDRTRCLYLTGNGVPLSQRWATVEDELKHIRVFFQLGIRMMHVTYNRRNMLGDGCGEGNDGDCACRRRRIAAAVEERAR